MKGKLRIQLVLWAVLFVVAMSFSAYAADGQIKIGQTASTTFPVVIDQPGSYVLTSNLVVSTANVIGIVIAADNVTLDLNGHALIGPGIGTGGNDARGIDGRFRKNVTIINGTVRDFPSDGIALHGSGWDQPTNGTNNQVKDIRAYGNGFGGIVVTNAIVTNSTANSNGWTGIAAESSAITDCTTNGNGIRGIGAKMSIISNCTTNSNGSYGVRASNTTITDCTANSNGGDGMHAFEHEFGWSSTIIRNCTANSNVNHGIFAHHNCRIEGNNLRGNGGHGLILYNNHNYAVKNVASDNGLGNFGVIDPAKNYMPTSLTGPDAASANVGW
jgi:hypothetical protein